MDEQKKYVYLLKYTSSRNDEDQCMLIAGSQQEASERVRKLYGQHGITLTMQDVKQCLQVAPSLEETVFFLEWSE